MSKHLVPPSHLRLPKPTITNPDQALFQHDPSPNTPLKPHWEPGCQPDEVYDEILPPWRAACRRYLVERLKGENERMADWQNRIRGEKRDRYFYWTAIFGTHTFFMTFLPMFFFFGSQERGRGMLNVVGLGIYISSFAKDLVCTPRPYSPPVVRLSMSTHHQEYGFPSSHSTNSVSIALYAGEWLWQMRESFGMTGLAITWGILLIYAASVVVGRLYCGMHSTADVIGGTLMGMGCWIGCLLTASGLEQWVNTGSMNVPLVAIPLALALVHYHPEPVDNCPCFEDAIAVLSVILGSTLGHWWTVYNGYIISPLSISEHNLIISVIISLGRMVIGIGLLFVWRLIAKSTLLKILPPIFRASSRIFEFNLPTRKHYTAATDYAQVPGGHLRVVPSFTDLGIGHGDSHSVEGTPEVESPPVLKEGKVGGSSSSLNLLAAGVRQRNKSKVNGGTVGRDGESTRSGKRKKRGSDHYDAEVLTKFGVYSGIGLLATTLAPMLFRYIEERIFMKGNW